MKKISLYTLLVLVLLTTMACSFTVTLPTIETGPDQTIEINEASPDVKVPFDVDIKIGAAKLIFSGGSKGLVDGTVVYNVIDWKPVINRTDTSLEISQGKVSNVGGVNVNDVKNNWILHFSESTPMNLTIDAGAYQGDMDFSGVQLASLTIRDGASDNTVKFRTPNPIVMSDLEYSTGASTVTMEGLANANFRNMNFNGGAGTYTLDFSGTLTQEADVRIEAGVSTTKIIIPAGMKAVIEVEGELKTVNTQGTWTVNDTIYSTDGQGPTLNISVSTNLGTLTLIQGR